MKCPIHSSTLRPAAATPSIVLLELEEACLKHPEKTNSWRHWSGLLCMCWFCLVLIPIVYNLLSIKAAIDGLLTVYWRSKNLEINWKKCKRWTERQYQTQWCPSSRSALLPRHTNPNTCIPDSRPPGLKMNPWEESYHKANQLNARWNDWQNTLWAPEDLDMDFPLCSLYRTSWLLCCFHYSVRRTTDPQQGGGEALFIFGQLSGNPRLCSLVCK